MWTSCGNVWECISVRLGKRCTKQGLVERHSRTKKSTSSHLKVHCVEFRGILGQKVNVIPLILYSLVFNCLKLRAFVFSLPYNEPFMSTKGTGRPPQSLPCFTAIFLQQPRTGNHNTDAREGIESLHIDRTRYPRMAPSHFSETWLPGMYTRNTFLVSEYFPVMHELSFCP